MVGFGSLSKILPSALPLASITPVGLSPSRASLPPGATSASSRILSASMAFGESSSQS
jgi:hypothetical protein